MNPWKILGVNRTMPLAEVRDVYIELAKKHHPDKSGDEQKFAVINGAYALLKDAEELRNFIEQQNAIGRPCTMCKGEGATFRQKGLTGRTATTCKTCEGSGIIFKKEGRK